MVRAPPWALPAVSHHSCSRSGHGVPSGGTPLLLPRKGGPTPLLREAQHEGFSNLNHDHGVIREPFERSSNDDHSTMAGDIMARQEPPTQMMVCLPRGRVATERASRWIRGDGDRPKRTTTTRALGRRKDPIDGLCHHLSLDQRSVTLPSQSMGSGRGHHGQGHGFIAHRQGVGQVVPSPRGGVRHHHCTVRGVHLLAPL
jgi:hypothetical protein